MQLYDGQNYSNTAYSNNLTIITNPPSPAISTESATNYVTQDLTCAATITDPESDPMNVSVRWYRNNQLHLSYYFNNSYNSGTAFSATLDAQNTTTGDIWSCSIRLYDRSFSAWGYSSSITIVDLPSNPPGGSGGGPPPILNATVYNEIMQENVTENITEQIRVEQPAVNQTVGQAETAEELMGQEQAEAITQEPTQIEKKNLIGKTYQTLKNAPQLKYTPLLLLLPLIILLIKKPKQSVQQ